MAVEGKQTAVDRLREFAATVLEMDVEQVTEDTLFYEDLEAASLQKAQISARVEREFRVRIDPENWAAMRTITDMVTLLRDRGVEMGE